MEAVTATGTKREVWREMKLTLPQQGGSFEAMKRVLSLLMAYVFLQTQSWALSGGPFGTEGSAGSLTGTYAGVLIPSSAVFGRSASIGLFTLAQPDAGLTTGTISVFVNGAAFAGTITGSMDPKTGSFDGVIDAQSSFQVVTVLPTTPPTTQALDVFAQGSIKARVSVDTDSYIFATRTATRSRIEGEAALDVFFQIDTDGTPIVSDISTYEVDGYKQSDS